MIETTNPMIERAIETATTELEITEDEQQALKRFLSRLRSIDSSHLPSSSNSNPVQNSVLSYENRQKSVTFHGQTSTQKEVIDAYRETVLQMDHYEEEYDNSIPEDIALEFGKQAARLIFLKKHLTANDIRNLIAQTEESLKERKQHARELARERDSLEGCDTELTNIEAQLFECPDPAGKSSGIIYSIWNDILELEERCRTLVTKRQDTIHSRRNPGLRGVDEQSLNRYLYRHTLSVECPALHDAISLLRDTDTQREHCERKLVAIDSTGDRSTNELNG